MRIPKAIKVHIAGKEIIAAMNIKYLSVIIDNTRKYIDHLESVSCKAHSVVSVMKRLLPNVNGPFIKVRRLYYNVWKSVISYNSPVWADALTIIKNKKILSI
jgi:hypothetical protein